MHYRFLLFLSMLPLLAIGQLQPVKQWRDHLSWHQAIAVSEEQTPAAAKIWCATPYSVFSVDLSDKSLERWSRISGLSETGISTIAFDNTNAQLIIAYNNSNIDILKNDKVVNIDAIKRSATTGNRSIYQIVPGGQLVYLSTGIGIIVIDPAKKEVADTWIIGNNGNKVKTTALSLHDGYFWASTEEGLKRRPAAGNNPADFRNWQLLSGSGGLPAGAVRSIFKAGNRSIVLKNDSLYFLNGNTWNYFYHEDQWQISNATISNNKIILSEHQTGAGRVVVLEDNGTVSSVIRNDHFTNAPQQTVFVKGSYWIADQQRGLSATDGNSFESFVPNSPFAAASGTMQWSGSTLFVAAGGTTSNWEPAGPLHRSTGRSKRRIRNETFKAVAIGGR